MQMTKIVHVSANLQNSFTNIPTRFRTNSCAYEFRSSPNISNY